jgi:hypothetical protein
MTLDTNQPTDQEVNSKWPYWMRVFAAEINSITATSGFVVTNLDIPLATTSLTVGVELSSAGHEIVICTGLGAAELATILGGTEGQIKTFIFQDANISILDGVKNSGKFYLDFLPALTADAFAIDDVLQIVNIGGDGAATYGYWKEINRIISIK